MTQKIKLSPTDPTPFKIDPAGYEPIRPLSSSSNSLHLRVVNTPVPIILLIFYEPNENRVKLREPMGRTRKTTLIQST